ncbi:MAG: cytochrome P450, partial [Bacteroidota bacterium]
MSKSYPLVGHALEFNKDRSGLFRRGYAEKGNVFAIKLGPKKAAVLIGAEFQTEFYKITDKALNMAKPYNFFKPIFGDVAFVANHETYMRQRPVLYAPFKRDKMLRYLEVMNEVVVKWLDRLPEEGEMEITGEMNRLVQDVAGYAFLGEAFMKEIGEDFWDNYVALGKALDPILPPNLPVPKFIRRNRARKRLVRVLQNIIDRRRAAPQDYDDFLQDFITQPCADGNPASDEEIIGLIIAFLFAGHETTAGQAAWGIIQLLQNPAYLADVMAEIQTKFPYGAHVDARSMANLRLLRWAGDETSRMYPSADMSIRVTDEDWEVGGYTIPKGWVVFVAGDVTHRMEGLRNQQNKTVVLFHYSMLMYSGTKCA